MSENTSKNWVVVATYPGRHIAEMMAELLRNQGIPATLSIDDTGGVYPQLALTLGAKVRVHPDDVERARQALEHRGTVEDPDTLE
mgnify:CR=1 FL=1